MSIYAGDFDRNGHIDPVLAHYVDGTEVSMPRRDRLLAQLPMLRQQFPDYESYATATISDLLSDQQRTTATVLRATRFASSYLENQGNGDFDIRALPPRAQLAPLYGLLATDVTGDGHLDVLAVGNSYAPDVITGRHDALPGLLLRGDGQGQFEAVSHRESGFFVDGDAKALVRLHDETDTPVYMATQNDDSTEVFRAGPDRPPLLVSPTSLETTAEIVFPDSTVQRREVYYGGGYLSHSSRRLQVPPEAVTVRLRTSQGSTRTVSLQSTGK